ncbi:hypothetical protein [Halorussus caseinilyticus]|uniref:Uncharacterized protein n=2 Tax=Halorussus caseinilyticus TaxID=3034025 RepID=A0ABD5WI54_9EURY
MLDAPFFIDAAQLDSFYDAVVQPKAERKESLKLEITEQKTSELSSNLDVDVSPLSVFGSLTKVLSPVEATVGGEAKKKRSKSENNTRTIELTPIDTPQRQLIQLVSQYLVNNSDRIFFVDDVAEDRGWFKDEQIEAVPRELVFLDLPSKYEAESYNVPETKLIPMAVEFEDGRIETLYDKLGATRRDDSWKPYVENFTPEESIRAIEEATEGKGKIEWINFRLPLDDERTARVHF